MGVLDEEKKVGKGIKATAYKHGLKSKAAIRKESEATRKAKKGAVVPGGPNDPSRIGGREVPGESTDFMGKSTVYHSRPTQRLVDGKVNPNFDPKAILPQGYFNEAGTFIPGPRVKLHEARTPEERMQIIKNMGELDVIGGFTKEGLERQNKLAIAGIQSQTAKEVARITGGTDINVSEIRSKAIITAHKIDADADKVTAAGKVTTPQRRYTQVDIKGQPASFDTVTGTYSIPGADAANSLSATDVDFLGKNKMNQAAIAEFYNSLTPVKRSLVDQWLEEN